MFLEIIMRKRKTPLQKELQLLEKQEKRYLEQRQKQNDSKLNKFLEDKVPDKLQETLEKAFSSVFCSLSGTLSSRNLLSLESL